MDEAWVTRYLKLLDVERGAPDLGLLRAITANHGRVPFENVTSMLRRRATPQGPVPPLDYAELLASWEQGSSGGVCYEVSGMVLELLRALGFEAHIAQGQITFPGSHQAVVTEVAGRSWLVDCGNGAPFGEPIPLDEPYELHRAGLSYRFRDEDGACVQDRLIGGEWQPFCRYELAPASDAEREAAYQRHHRLPAESFVLEELRIVRVLGDDVLQLGNRQFTHHTPRGRSRRELTNAEEYARVLADEFELPHLPIREGLAAWRELTGQGPGGWET